MIRKPTDEPYPVPHFDLVPVLQFRRPFDSILIADAFDIERTQKFAFPINKIDLIVGHATLARLIPCYTVSPSR
jgi:hypothetical protein